MIVKLNCRITTHITLREQVLLKLQLFILVRYEALVGAVRNRAHLGEREIAPVKWKCSDSLITECGKVRVSKSCVIIGLSRSKCLARWII